VVTDGLGNGRAVATRSRPPVPLHILAQETKAFVGRVRTMAGEANIPPLAGTPGAPITRFNI
jgi:hypothetical protein